MRPGGYGLLLASGTVDELIYNEIGNEAILIKYLDPPPTQKLVARCICRCPCFLVVVPKRDLLLSLSL